MSTTELLANNARYAASRAADHKNWNRVIGADTAIITCMDPRVNIDEAFQLSPFPGGKSAIVIRNAGGNTINVDRDLLISQRLASVKEIMVIHHTDCGGIRFSKMPKDEREAPLRHTLSKGGPWKDEVLEAYKKLPEVGGFLREEGDTDETVLVRSVRRDMERLRKSPVVKPDVKISGYIYELHSGKVVSIEGYDKA